MSSSISKTNEFETLFSAGTRPSEKVRSYIFIREINRRNEIQLTHFIGQFIAPWLALLEISIFRDVRPGEHAHVYYGRLDLIKDKIKAG